MTATPPRNDRILVVDDNRAIHDDFRKILCGQDRLTVAEARLFGTPDPRTFHIDGAEQGAAGLALVQQARADGRPYAMAFIDVRMPPGWDGIDTTRKIWEVDPDIQVVICTAYSDYSWDDINDVLGESDRLLILKKPFDSVEVIQFAHALTAKWRLLQESRQSMAEVIGSLPGIFYIIDEQGRFVRWNDSFEHVTGYSAQEISGMSVSDFLPEPEKGPVAGRIQRLLSSGEQAVDAFLVAKDRTRIPYLISAKPGSYNGARCIIGLGMDLTTQMELEAQLLQSQKMEVVGRLAGGIAHDFNNLLTVINSVAELAAATVKDGDPVRDDLREIHRAGTRAATLTRQLLAFSRKQVLHPEVLSLTTLVADLETMLRRVIGEDIRLAGSRAGAGLVRADRGQLEQAIMNLAVNARDAMPAGGELTIDVQDVASGPGVRLTVSDTGTGMDARTRSRIFEPFFTTKGSGQGTGLGLAMVDGVIRQSGGSISVDSEPGRGTTFTIDLPRVEDSVAAGGVAVLATPAAGTETILVVDDEEGVGRIARRILTSCGYTVLTASGGSAALLLLKRHAGAVHLMLTDVTMPSMSGPDLAAKAAETRPQMKVLFTSGFTELEEVRLGVAREAVNFIGKPYASLDLARKVRDVLDHVDTTGAGVTVPARGAA